MRQDAANAGTWLGYTSVCLLWVAVALSAPSARRVPLSRALWLAIMSAACATTLQLPGVPRLAAGITGSAQAMALTKHLLGVLSSGAILCFVSAAMGTSRLKRVSCVATAVVLAALLVLVEAGALRDRTRLSADSGGAGVAFALILIMTHLTADSVCVVVCLRCARQAWTQTFRASLRLFGYGTAFSGAFWLGYLMMFVSGDGRLY
ncbi:hypothetical protein AB0C13_29735, partial [Streptomyces sp. NPDC049099]